MSSTSGGPRSLRAMFVTNVEGEGPCVRIWAQEDSRTCAALEAMLNEAAGALDARRPPSLEELAACPLVAARVRGRFYRARLATPPRPPAPFVVRLVDFGNAEEVGPEDLRSLTGLPPALAVAPPQAEDFLLSGVAHPGGRWDPPLLEHLRRIVYYKEAACTFGRAVVGGRRLASVRVDGVDLAAYLIENGIALSTDPARQAAAASAPRRPRAPVSASAAAGPARAFRGRALDRDSPPVEAIVVAAEEGPDLFAVRLCGDERDHAELAAAIAALGVPEPIGPPADVGAVCLGRRNDAEPPGRAVVAGGAAAAEGPTLFFVDRGVAETVPWRNVYRIPDDLVAPPAFAMRFKLAGAPPPSDATRDEFARIVGGRRVTLRALPPDGSPLVPRCRLTVDGTDVATLLRSRAAPGEFRALVSFVASLSEFYAQSADNLDALDATMANVATRCATTKPLARLEARPGTACCALYPEDLRWYRARILAATVDGALVRYVDYGNEREVPSDALRPTTAALLELEEQAIRCALDGFESGPFDVDLSARFEELTIDRELRAVVKSAPPNGTLLVELIDDARSPPTSVGSLLRAVRREEPAPTLRSAEEDRWEPSPPRDRTPERARPEGRSPREYRKPVGPNAPLDCKPSERRESELRERGDKRPDENRPPKTKSVAVQKKPGDSRRQGSAGGFSKHGHRPRDYGNDKYENSRGRREKNYDNYTPKQNNYNKVSPSENRIARARDMETDSTPKYIKPVINSLKNPAPLNSKFKLFIPQTPYECNVKVSWFINPFNFYVQSVPLLNEFEKMMSSIPQLYCDIPPINGYIDGGSAVLAQYPSDKVLCRAKVIKNANSSQDEYLVYFVDFGNKCVVKKNKIWQLEKELLELPMLAVNCSLKGILPINGEWSKNYQEDPCFKEHQYKCTFEELNEEIYYVSLEYSGTSVNQLLVSYNLAVDKNAHYIREKGEKVEPDLIVGQCFYTKIYNVESMSKFFMCLNPPPNDGKIYKIDSPTDIHDFYSNQMIECSLFKFDSSICKIKPETFKKEQENKYVISYIDNIAENRLLVTLYDAITGQRFNYFPDEESVEYVSTVCAHPVFNHDFGLAFTSHIESVNELYLQRSQNVEALTQLLDNLFSFYTSEDPVENIVPEVDNLCAAKSCDGNWYRARITKKFLAECQVQYVDYGNKETVSLECLKVLNPQFFNINEQCLLCSLEVSPFEIDVDDLKNSIGDNEINAELSLNDIGWVANLTLNGENIVSNLKKDKSEAKSETSDLVSLYITHIDSPGQFWAQLSADGEKLKEIDTKLNEEAATNGKIEDFEIGKLCIAKYSADEQFYRAIILDSDSDITTVRFVDFGNTDVLDNFSENIKLISKELGDISPVAIKCSINASPIGTGEWTEQASELFTQFIGNTKIPITAKIILKDIITYVDLFVNNVNITNELVKAGLAISSEKQNNGKLPTGFASHINSPSEFWIQLENSVNDLEAVSEQLIDAENFPPITEIEEGVICAAKFPEDGCWYRAKIIIHGSNGTEVLFMDYGNASLTNELRSLPEKLKVLPALSRKCSLQKPAGIDMWSKDAEIKFSELAADGATIFEIKFIASGDLSIVELYIENAPITEKLITIPKEISSENLFVEEPIVTSGMEDYSSVRISHSHGPDDFWIQHIANINELNMINKMLTNAKEFQQINDPQEGAICVTLFLENNRWYRSKINGKGDAGVEVVHIDYGTTAISNELREMPTELNEITPLATNCCLYSNNLQFSESHHEMFMELLSKNNKEFHMEIVDPATNPMLVNLYVRDSDSFENILSLIGLDIYENLEYCITSVTVEHNIEEQKIHENKDKLDENNDEEKFDPENDVKKLDETKNEIIFNQKITEEKSEQVISEIILNYEKPYHENDEKNTDEENDKQKFVITTVQMETEHFQIELNSVKDTEKEFHSDNKQDNTTFISESVNEYQNNKIEKESKDELKQETHHVGQNQEINEENEFSNHSLLHSKTLISNSNGDIECIVEETFENITIQNSNDTLTELNDKKSCDDKDAEKLDASSDEKYESFESTPNKLEVLSDTFNSSISSDSQHLEVTKNEKITETPKCENFITSSVINDFVDEENNVEKKLSDSIEKKDIQ